MAVATDEEFTMAEGGVWIVTPSFLLPEARPCNCLTVSGGNWLLRQSEARTRLFSGMVTSASADRPRLLRCAEASDSENDLERVLLPGEGLAPTATGVLGILFPSASFL